MMEQNTEETQDEKKTPEVEEKVSHIKKSFSSVAKFLIEFFKTAIIIGLVAFIIRYFLVQPFIVEGASMEPSFHNNNYLLIEKISDYFSAPKRGDVVVFRYPENPEVNYIKRIIGLPGDKVVIENGTVKIYPDDSPDGIELQEDYLLPGTTTRGDITITLQKDEYFVMGDNRNNSSDSRDWGVLPKENIVGKAWVVIIPGADFGLVPQTHYNL